MTFAGTVLTLVVIFTSVVDYYICGVYRAQEKNFHFLKNAWSNLYPNAPNGRKWQEYCIHHYFRVQLFLRFWPGAVIREWLISRFC